MEKNLGGEHVGQPSGGALQSDASEEEDGEDEVGEDGGEVDNFPRGRDAFHHDQEDNDPGRGQTENVPVF